MHQLVFIKRDLEMEAPAALREGTEVSGWPMFDTCMDVERMSAGVIFVASRFETLISVTRMVSLSMSVQ